MNNIGVIRMPVPQEDSIMIEIIFMFVAPRVDTNVMAAWKWETPFFTNCKELGIFELVNVLDDTLTIRVTSLGKRCNISNPYVEPLFLEIPLEMEG